MTYISIQHSSLPKALGLVVVVDAEVLEQDFVLVGCHCSFESLLCFTWTHASLLNQGPEGSIV